MPLWPPEDLPATRQRDEHFLSEVIVQRRRLAGFAAHDAHVKAFSGKRRVRLLTKNT